MQLGMQFKIFVVLTNEWTSPLSAGVLMLYLGIVVLMNPNHLTFEIVYKHIFEVSVVVQ